MRKIVALLLVGQFIARQGHAQQIIVQAKAQSESVAQNFNFTGSLGAFTLRDAPDYTPIQDIGVNGNNRIAVVDFKAGYTNEGGIYYLDAGSTTWVQIAGAAERVDVDLSNRIWVVNKPGGLFNSSGGNFVEIAGINEVKDVGANANGTEVYVMAGAGAQGDLYRYDGGSTWTKINNVLGVRLDVAPNGHVWYITNGGDLYEYNPATGTTAGPFRNTADQLFSDVTVAADGSLWVTGSGGYGTYRFDPNTNTFVGEANAANTTVLSPENMGNNRYFTGGISAGSDGDLPFTTPQIRSYGQTNELARLAQRTEDGTWIDDLTIRTDNFTNTAHFNVAAGTYTVSLPALPANYVITSIRTSGGTVAVDLATRTATVTVGAGQTAYLEYNIANTQSTVLTVSPSTPYIETFGSSGVQSPSIGPVLPNGYTNYHYASQGGNAIVMAGTYTLGNAFILHWQGMADPGNVTSPTASSDHTPGDQGGYYVAYNGGFIKDEVFRRQFTGLTLGTSYTVSFWATELTNVSGPFAVKPNLIVNATDPTTGTLLATTTTGDIAWSNGAWNQYTMSFTATSPNVTIALVNNQQLPGTYGNDFALDDISIGVSADHGDAPASYGTLNANTGPAHILSSGLTLGAVVDAESDGYDSQATGDNTNGINDEDAISGTLPSLTNLATTYTLNGISVRNSNTSVNTAATLYGWIDFNRNGVFDANERSAAVTVAPNATSVNLSWTGLTGGVAGTSYVRLRLAYNASEILTPTGDANTGEVEDYSVVIEQATVALSGSVLNDANGLKDNTVNGTPTNTLGSNTLYANLINNGVVVASIPVASDGTYLFPAVNVNTAYSVVLTNALTTVGSPAPTASLTNAVYSGEFLGTGAGSDGTPDGVLAINVGTTPVTNANFGVNQLPETNAVTASTQTDPGGSSRVVVPALSGSDPEDGALGSGKTFIISTLPTNATLYYNGQPVTANQTIPNYNPALLQIDPNDGVTSVSFTYASVDAAGQPDPTPATVTIPFGPSPVPTNCPETQVPVSAFLGGAMQNVGSGGFLQPAVMRDDLRSKSYFPTSEPYSGLGYTVTLTNNTTTNAGVLARSGSTAVIDWVLIELRNPQDNTQLIASRPGLLLQNGQVTEAADGTTPLRFTVPPGNYYVSIRHRNHLGVMTATPVVLGSAVDFTNANLDVYNLTTPLNYDGAERANLGTLASTPGKAALWWGNAKNTSPSKVKYEGADNDGAGVESAVLTAPGNVFNSPSYVYNAYNAGDVNLDGSVIYQGQSDDIMALFNAVAQFPLNSSNQSNYDLMYEQLPATVAYNGPALSCEKPTPVSLVSFTAKALENKTVELNWKTAGELNNKGFTVERSLDLVTFEKVGEIHEVAGTSTQVHTYRLVDQNPYRGTSYYRLVQLDLDGTLHPYRPQSVIIDGEYRAYPNPVQGSAFRVRLDEPVKAKVSLSTVDGRSLPISRKAESNNTVLIQVEGTAGAGVYLLRVEERSQVRIHKIILNP